MNGILVLDEVGRGACSFISGRSNFVGGICM
jgi:hypothetical protein